MTSNPILVLSERVAVSLVLQDAFNAGEQEAMCLASPELARDVIGARAVDLAVVDADAGLPESVVAAALESRVPVLTVLTRPEQASQMVRDPRVENFVVGLRGSHQPLYIDAEDLVATKNKITADEPFGLRAYVSGERIRYVVDGCDDSHRMAMCIRDDLQARGHSRVRAARVALLSHQLATAALERSSDAVSDVTIEIAFDPRTIGVALTFGPLNKNDLDSLVRSCLDDGATSSAADDFGLPSLLAWCRTVLVNVEEGARTELIGLLPANVEQGGQQVGSLHVSIRQGSAACSAPSPVVETVDLSDSMRLQLIDQAVVGQLGICEAIPREISFPRPAPMCRAAASRKHNADLGHILRALDPAGSESDALKIVLGYLRARYQGAAILEVGLGSVVVWGGGGKSADVSALYQFRVDANESSTLGFLASEPALVSGCPGNSSADKQLARLVAGDEDAFGVFLSIVVHNKVRYILYGCQPWVDKQVAEEELEILGKELARSLCGFAASEQWWQEPSAPVSIAYDATVAAFSSGTHN